jgi:predicted PurR-regulated permease PerM
VILGVTLIGAAGLLLAIPVAVVLMELVRDYDLMKQREIEAQKDDISEDAPAL